MNFHYLDHISRSDNSFDVFYSKTNRRCPRGNQRATWMNNRKKLTSMDEAVAQKLTADQTKWDTVVNKALLTWRY